MGQTMHTKKSAEILAVKQTFFRKNKIKKPSFPAKTGLKLV